MAGIAFHSKVCLAAYHVHLLRRMTCKEPALLIRCKLACALADERVIKATPILQQSAQMADSQDVVGPVRILIVQAGMWDGHAHHLMLADLPLECCHLIFTYIQHTHGQQMPVHTYSAVGGRHMQNGPWSTSARQVCTQAWSHPKHSDFGLSYGHCHRRSEPC